MLQTFTEREALGRNESEQKLLALCGISCCDIGTNGLEGLAAKKLTSANNEVPQAFSDYNIKTNTKTHRCNANAPSARQYFALLESVVRSGAVLLNSRASGGITLAALNHVVCEVHWCGKGGLNQMCQCEITNQ